MNIGEQWQAAYEKAEFYRSENNTKEYWDKVSKADGGGLTGVENILIIRKYLSENGFIGKDSTVLDIGCGGGDYVELFAEICRHVTALDYSQRMIEACRSRCESRIIENVSFLSCDFTEYIFSDRFDCILSCLNPSTYNPRSMDKMLSMTDGCVVYFSMDTPIENAETEPIYRGCNSVRYAEEYLKERGYSYAKIPYLYELQTDEGLKREIPFAYIIVRQMDRSWSGSG